MKKIATLLMTVFCLMAMPHPAHAQVKTENYKMAGPYEIVARDGAHRRTKAGSERDMLTAHECAKKGQHETALMIINAYAGTLQGFDGHDAPLCAIQAYDLVRAMTILHAHATPEWSKMIRRAMLPTIEAFDAKSPYANGNWGAIVNRLRMACGIFLQDSTLYKASIDYHLHANDNGSLPNYVGPTGQCQETGRDQGHAQLGLGMLCDICEMAWEQGDDLWGALDNRLLLGMEYTARYNLGYDVPFETWKDCTGLYNDWTEPGAMGRGKMWDIYQKAYDHYVGRKGLEMPYCKKVLDLRAKAEKKGELKSGTFMAPGVTEGKKLHQTFTYPAPEGAPLNDDYDVFIQPRGSKEWTKIDTYKAKVNSWNPDNKTTGHSLSECSYAAFDFTGDVFVRVVTKGRTYKMARVRPDYRGVIAHVQNDSTMQFLLFQPENVSVEFADANGWDTRHNLMIFTSKPSKTLDEAKKEAKKQGRRFVSFKPGYYHIEDGKLTAGNTLVNTQGIEVKGDSLMIPSNTTVYLEGSAYFNATFAVNDAHNVSILGRGIARPERGYEGAHVYRSGNVLIDGLTVNTCPIGESRDVTLRDVRSISHPQWGDGLNVFGGCENILFDRVFCRNSDDCTTVYATRKGFKGSVKNVRMTNSTLWADVAHPIMIGLHGAPCNSPTAKSDTIAHLIYENIDIICQAENQIDYQGCMAINCGDDNVVKDVVFDNIRIEQITHGSLMHIKVVHNDKYGFAPGKSIEDVRFHCIRYTGTEPKLSIITGYSTDRKVSGILFDDVRINGRHLYDKMRGKPSWYHTSDYIPAYVGPHVENLRFK